MSLARLWRDPSKRRQARELLAPVYGWFMEGFDMRDLASSISTNTGYEAYPAGMPVMAMLSDKRGVR